jgi:hypothetical protein
MSTKTIDLGMSRMANLEILLQYGPHYLSRSEFETCKYEALENYWRWLGTCVLKLKGKKFWKFHTSKLNELGYPVNLKKILLGTVNEIIEELYDPKVGIHKFLNVIKSKFQSK